MLLFAHNYTFFAVLMSGHCPQRKNVKLLRDMQAIHHPIQSNKTNHFRVIKDKILIKLRKTFERRFILAYDFNNRIIQYSFIWRYTLLLRSTLIHSFQLSICFVM